MSKPHPNIFNAQELISWRDGMGFSQRHASERLGCSRNALRDWESGEHPIPRYIALACHAIAAGFDAVLPNDDEERNEDPPQHNG